MSEYYKTVSTAIHKGIHTRRVYETETPLIEMNALLNRKFIQARNLRELNPVTDDTILLI